MHDAKLNALIKSEYKRLGEVITLIPSENYPSPEVLRLVGSALITKYAEGYPGRRYYPGNAVHDKIEMLAAERALKLFKLSSREWAANVQPYSGSPANLAVYLGLLKPGDTILGLQLSSGGHLTHGHRVSSSGMLFHAIQYEVDKETGELDYRAIERLAKKHRPKLIISGATAYPRTIDFKAFGAIAKKVNAYHMADISHIAGLIAGGVHPSPFPHTDIVTSTTHKTLRGPRGAIILSKTAKSKDSSRTIAERIDRAIFPGLQGGPHMHTIAGIAQTLFEASRPSFKAYAKQVVHNAAALAEALKARGFRMLTGGTDTHLILLDLRDTRLTGSAAESVLEKNNLLANRNTFPGDTSPFRPSGLRLGTPAATTRGMKEREMELLAECVRAALIEKRNVKDTVLKLAKKFPLPYRS